MSPFSAFGSIAETAKPFGQYSLVLGLLVVPVAVDPSVFETSGDLRWSLIHAVSAWAAACACLVLAFDDKIRSRFFRQTEVYMVGAFLVICCISLIDPINPERSFYSLRHTVAYALVFLAGIILFERKHLYLIVAAACAPLLINSPLIIGQYLCTDGRTVVEPQEIHALCSFIAPIPQTAPPAATFANKNIAASWFALLLPMVASAVLITKNRVTLIFSTIVLSLVLACLTATAARASWIGAMLAMMVFASCLAWLHRRSPGFTQQVRLPRIGLVIAASTVGIVSILLIAKPTGAAPATKIAEVAQMFQGDLPSSFRVRLLLYQKSLAMIADRPLLGSGLGTFPIIFPAYWLHGSPMQKLRDFKTMRPQRAHSDLLQLAAEIGLPGALLLISLAVMIALRGARIILSDQFASPAQTTTLLAAGAGLGGVIAVSMVDFPFHLPTAPFVAAILASILVIFSQSDQADTMRGDGRITHLALPIEKSPAVRRQTPLINAAMCTAAISFVLLGIWGWSADMTRRKALQIARPAAGAVLFGVATREVRERLDMAQAIYPNLPRVIDYKAQLYANYAGTDTLNLDRKIEKLAFAVDRDPFAPHSLLNFAGGQFHLAIRAALTGDTEQARAHASKIISLADAMSRTPHWMADKQLSQALAHALLGNTRLASRALHKGLEHGPDHPGLQRLAGLMRQQALLDDPAFLLSEVLPALDDLTPRPRRAYH